jgi:hypothetical protein
MKRIMLVGAALASLLMACGEEEKEKAPLASIALEADADFTVGTTVQLRVLGTREDGTVDDLTGTEGIVYASSDEEIATVDPTGLVTVLVGGPVSFTAQFEALATPPIEARTRCQYPRFAPDIEFSQTMPPLSWPAKMPDGTEFHLSLEDVYCDREWQDVDVLVMITSAAWCNPCTQYAKELSKQYEELLTHRMQILYVMAQDLDYAPADTKYGWNHMDRITGGKIPGIVVGDAETWPEPAFVQKSSQVQFFPSSWVIRTRDMKIIASGNRSDDRLDLASIADHPENDWSTPGRPVFKNRCEPGMQEDSEPNDTPEQAVAAAPGTYEGGICKDKPDLYQVDLAGTWEMRLSFDNEVGDLDLYLWDPVTNDILFTEDGQIIASTGSTNEEVLEFTGPALVGVKGFRHASAGYTLTLTEK